MQKSGEKTKIVVVGAGSAGVAAALNLAGFARNRRQIELTIINDGAHYPIPHRLRDYLTGRAGEETNIPLDLIFDDAPVKIVDERVFEINAADRVVDTTSARFFYDYLVAAPGSIVASRAAEGFERHGFPLRNRRDASALREHVTGLFEAASIESDADARRAMLTFVIAGEGMESVELAIMMSEWVEELRLKHWVPTEEIEVVFACKAAEFPADNLEPVRKAAERELRERGIRHLMGAPVEKVGASSVELASGQIIPTKTAIFSGFAEAEPLIGCSGFRTDERGRALCGPDLRTDYPGIYVAGSCAHPVDPAKPIAEETRSSWSEGVVAAKNIRADLTGKATVTCHRPFFSSVYYLGEGNPMVTVGESILPYPISFVAERLQTPISLFRLGGMAFINRYRAWLEGERPVEERKAEAA